MVRPDWSKVAQGDIKYKLKVPLLTARHTSYFLGSSCRALVCIPTAGHSSGRIELLSYAALMILGFLVRIVAW